MSMPAYPIVLASAAADGTALTNSTSATNILHGSGIGVIPGGALQMGSLVKITASGRISTLVTTPGTLTFDVRFGSVIVFNGGALSLNVTAQTNAAWWLEIMIVARALGNSTNANALGSGQWRSRAAIGSAAVATSGVFTTPMPDTAPAVGTGFDSTSAQSVNLFGTWSVANAANSIQVHQSVTELKV